MEQQEKSLNCDRWVELSTKILDSAKQELFIAMRYLFAPLNLLNYERNRMISFVATDGEKLYYNPMQLIRRYQDSQVSINRTYIHMVFHCMFKHVYEKDVRDEEIWNLACDIAVEYLIDGIELSCVMLPENSDRLKVYAALEKRCVVMSAVNIYSILMLKMRSEADMLTATGLFYVDDHCYWRCQNRDNADSDNDDENSNRHREGDDSQDEKRWEEAARQMQTAYMAGNGRGDRKGGLRKALGAATHSKTSYRDFLKRFVTVRETVHTDLDSFDYGYYSYGLMVYGNMPLIEENEYREESGIEDFVIVLDTSGSCALSLTKRFVTVTLDVLETSGNFFDNMNLHIIQCDNEVQSDTVIRTQEDAEAFRRDFNIKGFGGTDFRPAFNYVNKLRQAGDLKRIRGLLYFTDGYGVYPANRQDYDVAFVYMGDYDADREVPGWVIRLDIDEAQLE